ncbi:hypothetical protein JOM56_003238 [Amanita muscaria]
MKLANDFSALKIKPASLKFRSWPYPIPPIEYSTDSDSESRKSVKVNKTPKAPRKIIVKKSKFRDDMVYYSSGEESSDGEHADSDSAPEQTEPDYEWINFIRKRAADKAAAQANAAGGVAAGGVTAGGAAMAT